MRSRRERPRRNGATPLICPVPMRTTQMAFPLFAKNCLMQWEERASVFSSPYFFSNAVHVWTCCADVIDPLGNDPMMAAVEVEAESITGGTIDGLWIDALGVE